MFRLNAFRSHAPWAVCVSLALALWVASPRGLPAQDAAGEQAAPAQAAPAEGDKPADSPAAVEAPPAEDKPAEDKPAEVPATPDAPKDGATATEAPKAETPSADAPKTPTADAPKTPAASAIPEVKAPTSPTEPAEPRKADEPAASDAREAAKLPSDVSVLTPEARFRLVDQLRVQDDRVTPTEYEQGRKLDPDLTPDKDFEALDLDKNQSLSVDEFAAGFTKIWLVVLIVLATLVLPFLVAIWICRAIRLPEYSARMGFVLLAIAASAVIISLGQLRFGIDLRGGVILVYQVDEEKTKALSETGDGPDGNYMDRLIAALNLRVNPGGQKEIVIRRFGENEVEIIVPEAQPAEIEQLKKTIRTAGFLEFRIMLNQQNLGDFLRVPDPEKVLADAMKPDSPIDVRIPFENFETGKEELVTVARWLPIDPEQVNLAQEQGRGALIHRKNAEGQDEVLAGVRDPAREREWVVRGNELSSAGQTRDPDTGEPAVDFRMTTLGAANLGEMTGEYAPEPDGLRHRMGIVFDGKLISAPGLKSVIHDSGIITGSYTKQDVSLMVSVLNAGSLPAVLIETPVSQNDIGATVGEDTIEKGRTSMLISTALVLAFMAAFYRFSGIVACVALLLNVAITFAVIILFKAPLTLPGLAGLALGVGMAVDANVLIFERIREELQRGAALRMAIRNGFDRASTTIIDSNLTTVITGLILYWIGTDQVKGFAITLIIGIAANLFTAITFSRLVFDIADKKRLLSKLTMSKLIEGTNFDFIGKQRLLIGASVVLIVVGLAACYTRGITLLDIDFAGGTSADVVFTTEQNIDELRKRLGSEGILDATVSKIQRQDAQSVQFKIDTSLGNPSSLPIEFTKRDIDPTDGKLTPKEYEAKRTGRAATFAQARFAELDLDGNGSLSEDEFKISREDVLYFYLEGVFGNELRRNALTYTPPAPIAGATSAVEDEASAARALVSAEISTPTSELADHGSRSPFRLASYQTDAAAKEETKPDGSPAPAPDATPVTPAAPAAPKESDVKSATGDAAADAAKPDPETPDPEKTDPTKADPSADPLKPPASPETPATAAGSAMMQSSSSLTFAEKVSYKEVHGSLDSLIKEKFPGARTRITHTEEPGSQEATLKWNVETTLSPTETKTLLDAYAAKLAAEPVFPAASSIGPNVADKAKQQAVFAIVVALLAIIVYVWIRFQKVVYGVAAVVALAHDVLVTLGLIGLSSYFAEAVPGLAEVLKIDPFKINLTVVAAFLTIIGFSINDTIVIFDRIREVRGKSPYLTVDMVNGSVNQMLGRTFLTSFTVLMVVFILYFFGGDAIHAFAFAMLVGLISGVYSTVFIANPIVLWLSQKPQPTKVEVRTPARVA